MCVCALGKDTNGPPEVNHSFNRKMQQYSLAEGFYSTNQPGILIKTGSTLPELPHFHQTQRLRLLPKVTECHPNQHTTACCHVLEQSCGPMASLIISPKRGKALRNWGWGGGSKQRGPETSSPAEHQPGYALGRIAYGPSLQETYRRKNKTMCKLSAVTEV